MENTPTQKSESTTPRSVRFTPETETRLRALLGDSILSFPQLLDFAVTHLLDEMAAGKEIRLSGKKMQLVDATSTQAASPATPPPVPTRTQEIVAQTATKKAVPKKSRD